MKQNCVVGDDLHQLPPKDKEEAEPSSENHDPTGLELLKLAFEKNPVNPFDDFESPPTNQLWTYGYDYIGEAVKEVAKAAALVPKVDQKGRRVKEEAPEREQPKCQHKPYFKKDGSRAACVCEWNEPKRRPNEDQVAYNLRLANWKTNRYAVAKKRGVALQ